MEIDLDGEGPADRRLALVADRAGRASTRPTRAVRITHLPTGLVVDIQDEKSQHKNKAKAMTVLRARLLEVERQRQAEERGEQRRSQVGSGDRAEKIRTYNFPDDRVTDHRIGLTVHNLPGLLEGDLDRIVEPLAERDQADRLAELGADGARRPMNPSGATVGGCSVSAARRLQAADGPTARLDAELLSATFGRDRTWLVTPSGCELDRRCRRRARPSWVERRAAASRSPTSAATRSGSGCAFATDPPRPHPTS